MTRLLASAALAALLATPALARDDDLGAYLYEGGCDGLSSDAIVKDVGDLDQDGDAAEEWARLDPSGAAQPNPF